MDELELRRRCYAEPNDPSPEFRAALAEDPRARQLAENMRRFDRNLEAALKQAPVPDGLAGRILLRTGFERRRRRHRRQLGYLALAASVVLAVALTLLPLGGPRDFPSLALAHVYGEMDHLEERTAVGEQQLRAMLQRVGGELTASIEGLRFAGLCPSPRGTALHLVVDGEMGPVTILYVPGAKLDGGEKLFGDQRFVGLARAQAQGGSLAVIGHPGEPLEQVAARLQQRIRWTEAPAA